MKQKTTGRPCRKAKTRQKCAHEQNLLFRNRKEVVGNQLSGSLVDAHGCGEEAAAEFALDFVGNGGNCTINCIQSSNCIVISLWNTKLKRKKERKKDPPHHQAGGPKK